jgi:uncharacterized protein YidB (DUF937 family)
MGLLDQVIGAASSKAGQSAGIDNSLLATVMQLVNNPQTGGLAGLVQTFQKGGLAHIVNSWVSTGQNLPISPDQIKSVLGGEQIQSIASKLGISSDQVSGQLAGLLPQVVDRLTPNGTLPESKDLMSKGLDLLKGKF